MIFHQSSYHFDYDIFINPASTFTPESLRRTLRHQILILAPTYTSFQRARQGGNLMNIIMRHINLLI